MSSRRESVYVFTDGTASHTVVENPNSTLCDVVLAKRQPVLVFLRATKRWPWWPSPSRNLSAQAECRS
jgi:hypothetical protein